MPTEVLNQLIKQADTLSPDEQLRLAAYLVERARQTCASTRRKWHQIRGLARTSLFGEDAQIYISRIRREADEHRTSVLKHKP